MAGSGCEIQLETHRVRLLGATRGREEEERRDEKRRARQLVRGTAKGGQVHEGSLGKDDTTHPGSPNADPERSDLRSAA